MLAQFLAGLAHTGIPHMNNDSNNNTIMLPSLSQGTQTNVLKAFLWFDDFSQLASSRSPTSHFQRATIHAVPKGLTIPAFLL